MVRFVVEGCEEVEEMEMDPACLGAAENRHDVCEE